MKPNLKSQSKGNKPDILNDLSLFREAYSVAKDYLVKFVQDIPNFLPSSLYGSADSVLDCATIKRRFDAEGLEFATKTLPKLSAGLFQYFETGHVCYPSFRIKKGTVHPIFLSGLFRLACRDGEYQGVAIKLIYQISVMFKKLKGPYPDSVLSKQLADFVKVDKDLANLQLDSYDLCPILERAREEVNSLFKGYSLESRFIKPRPGPGATNHPVAKHMRFRPHVLYTQIDNVMPYVDFFNVHPYDIVHQTAHYQRLYNNAVAEQRARFKFVHKQVGKARGICIEENETQFMQQAMKRSLYDWLEKHPLTRGRVNFTDQSINMDLALEASTTREYATIDMSEASDRISRKLVHALFKDQQELLAVLDGLSTKWIDLPDLGDGPQAIECNKYAPMGSGLCFPIMSIAHWALCRSIMAVVMQEDTALEEVYVYGDDIILPSRCVEAIYKWLPPFGMKLNQEKSYSRSNFRESCGIHAYKGIDVTPIFIKYLPLHTSYKVTLSCISVEAQFFHKGYTGIASLLEGAIRQAYKGYEMPYVPMSSSVFGIRRADRRLPSTCEGDSKRFDSWGNPVYRVRVIGPVSEDQLPPTEVESYLRHVLTQDAVHEVRGEPISFEAKWVLRAIPALYESTQLDECIKPFVAIRDARPERDIKLEALYEFKPQEDDRVVQGSNQPGSPRRRRCGYSKDGLSGCPAAVLASLRNRLQPWRSGSNRVSRRSLCRGCPKSLQCAYSSDD